MLCAGLTLHCSDLRSKCGNQASNLCITTCNVQLANHFRCESFREGIKTLGPEVTTVAKCSWAQWGKFCPREVTLIHACIRIVIYESMHANTHVHEHTYAQVLRHTCIREHIEYTSSVAKVAQERPPAAVCCDQRSETHCKL